MVGVGSRIDLKSLMIFLVSQVIPTNVPTNKNERFWVNDYLKLLKITQCYFFRVTYPMVLFLWGPSSFDQSFYDDICNGGVRYKNFSVVITNFEVWT